MASCLLNYQLMSEY